MCYPNFTALIFVTTSIFIKTNVGAWFKKSYQIRPTYRPTFDLPLCRYFIVEGIIPRVGRTGIPIRLITWSAFLLLLLLFHCSAHILGWFYKTKKIMCHLSQMTDWHNYFLKKAPSLKIWKQFPKTLRPIIFLSYSYMSMSPWVFYRVVWHNPLGIKNQVLF